MRCHSHLSSAPPSAEVSLSSAEPPTTQSQWPTRPASLSVSPPPSPALSCWGSGRGESSDPWSSAAGMQTWRQDQCLAAQLHLRLRYRQRLAPVEPEHRSDRECSPGWVDSGSRSWSPTTMEDKHPRTWPVPGSLLAMTWHIWHWKIFDNLNWRKYLRKFSPVDNDWSPQHMSQTEDVKLLQTLARMTGQWQETSPLLQQWYYNNHLMCSLSHLRPLRFRQSKVQLKSLNLLPLLPPET